MNLWLWRGRGKGGEKIDWEFENDVHSATFKIDHQQAPTVQHRELGSMFCNNLNGKGIFKRINTCICKNGLEKIQRFYK